VIAEAGIDTARVLYRVRDERDQARLTEVCDGAPMLPGEYGGLRAGWMPKWELLWVEGRPAKSLGLGERLLPAAALREGLEAPLKQVRQVAAIAQPTEVGVSRLDATVTVALDRPADGWAVLRGMAALDMPRRKVAVYELRGHPETVYRLTLTGKVRERVYDKGAQLGTDEPGQRIRFEAQTRWGSGWRDTMGHWHAERVAEEYERRFRPMAQAADGLRVASPAVIGEQLREHVEAGTITPRQAELLLGHIGCEGVGIHRARRSEERRRAELRRLGLAHALDGGDQVNVPLDEILGELETASWNG
jgi:hypothetical protein